MLRSSRALPFGAAPPAHPLASPASMPWVVVVIVVLTVGVGHWAAAEVLALISLAIGLVKAVRSPGA